MDGGWMDGQTDQNTALSIDEILILDSQVLRDLLNILPSFNPNHNPN